MQKHPPSGPLPYCCPAAAGARAFSLALAAQRTMIALREDGEALEIDVIEEVKEDVRLP